MLQYHQGARALSCVDRHLQAVLSVLHDGPCCPSRQCFQVFLCLLRRSEQMYRCIQRGHWLLYRGSAGQTVYVTPVCHTLLFSSWCGGWWSLDVFLHYAVWLLLRYGCSCGVP